MRTIGPTSADGQQTIYTWSSERRIDTVKIGRAMRIRISTVEKLIEDGDRPALPAIRFR
jgi:hypothetical protein